MAGADRTDRGIGRCVAVIDIRATAKELRRRFELDVDLQADNWGVFHVFELIATHRRGQGANEEMYLVSGILYLVCFCIHSH